MAYVVIQTCHNKRFFGHVSGAGKALVAFRGEGIKIGDLKEIRPAIYSLPANGVYLEANCLILMRKPAKISVVIGLIQLKKAYPAYDRVSTPNTPDW